MRKNKISTSNATEKALTFLNYEQNVIPSITTCYLYSLAYAVAVYIHNQFQLHDLYNKPA